MIEVICRIYSKWKHTSMIITGLFMLEEQGFIKLVVEDYRTEGYKYSRNECGIELEIEGKICHVDLSDGYMNYDEVKDILKDCDYYFKRSFSEELNKQYGAYSDKIYPLGLNFTVYNEKSAQYQVLPYGKRDYYLKKFASRLLGMKLMNEYYLEDFMQMPDGVHNDMSIIFMTRLWKSRDGSGSCDDINQMRIDIMRKMRKLYGKCFVGGMSNDELSREKCPDLIVSKYMTNRKNYLNAMKHTDIGIATTGLHGSIGGKFAEYIVASKAIVSERLNYYVPGLMESKNYYEFNSVDSCIEQVDNLLNNPELVYEMKLNNWKYFQEELSPDKQVMNIIDVILSSEKK